MVVGRFDEIRPGITKRVVVSGVPVVLANVDGAVYTIDDLCTHGDSSLSTGCLRGKGDSCTLYGSRGVVTGKPKEDPAAKALRTWPGRVDGNSILLQAGT